MNESTSLLLCAIAKPTPDSRSINPLPSLIDPSVEYIDDFYK